MAGRPGRDAGVRKPKRARFVREPRSGKTRSSQQVTASTGNEHVPRTSPHCAPSSTGMGVGAERSKLTGPRWFQERKDNSHEMNFEADVRHSRSSQQDTLLDSSNLEDRYKFSLTSKHPPSSRAPLVNQPGAVFFVLLLREPHLLKAP
jgi:hypothetical protein